MGSQATAVMNQAQVAHNFVKKYDFVKLELKQSCLLLFSNSYYLPPQFQKKVVTLCRM